MYGQEARIRVYEWRKPGWTYLSNMCTQYAHMYTQVRVFVFASSRNPVELDVSVKSAYVPLRALTNAHAHVHHAHKHASSFLLVFCFAVTVSL